MKIQKFSKSEALQFGWNVMKNNIGFFVVVLVFSGLVSGASDIIDKLIEKGFIEKNIFIYLTYIILWILSIIINLGLIKIFLKFCDNEKPRFNEIFSQYRLFFRYLFIPIVWTKKSSLKTLCLTSAGPIIKCLSFVLDSIGIKLYPLWG